MLGLKHGGGGEEMEELNLLFLLFHALHSTGECATGPIMWIWQLASMPWHGTNTLAREILARHGTEKPGTAWTWHGTARKLRARARPGAGPGPMVKIALKKHRTHTTIDPKWIANHRF